MGSVYILLMVVLLGCSAFFSGSETAFFQLSPRTVRQFAASKNRTERLIAATLADPGRFLTALLFGNMLINVLYFALTSTLSFQLTRSADSVAGGASIAVGGFILLLLFGEMLPKSLAYTNTHRFCLATAAVCYLLLKILGPLVSTLDWLIARPVIRLLVQPQTDTGVSTKQLKVLLDSSRQQGAISSSENQLMSEILKFSFLKVRHVMKPRVEMPACSLQMPPQAAIEKMLASDVVEMGVYDESIDSVAGIVHLKDLFLHPEKQLSEIVRPAQFVPEQKSAESLIDFFQQTQTDAAIVVDEYGGVAGWVELDDITEQLLGPLEKLSNEEPIEKIAPMEYRLRADLPIHEWMEAFGIDIQQERQVTIGGFVTALLGKIPKEGDEVVFQNIKFMVERTKKNRIQTIRLSLIPLGKTTKGAK